MPRLKTVYRCQECGFSAAKGLGQCPGCSAWNVMVEEVVGERTAALALARPARAITEFSSPVTALRDVAVSGESRRPTGLMELDRLLGGGVVEGQILLLAGPPGIGKSTLMLQAAASFAKDGKVLYVSGEESLRQISARARRLGIDASSLYLLSETNLAKVVSAAEEADPAVLILDSIQTAYHPEIDSSPGSVAQVRECAAEMMRLAKGGNAVVFLLGHVTKEGVLAGPKVLEHIVDTVLYFDTEQHDLLRVLRAHKNRFGPTDEIGFFEMGERGLKEVKDALSFFMEDRADEAASGRAVSVALEGSRPILVESQALVVSTRYPLPRRMATGLDLNRVLVLLAAMERHLKLRLEDRDVFLSLSGGVRLKDPALDLASCLSVFSSFHDRPFPSDWVAVGEVGLLGEVRRVPQGEARLREAAKAGFRKAVVAQNAAKEMPRFANLEVIGVRSLAEAVALLEKN